METILEKTSDGSHTLFVPELNEHYHSVNGAVQESKHVFLEAGLKQVPGDKLRILEVGFGTGLNAYLTFLQARDTAKRIHFTSVELYPLPETIINELNYPAMLSPDSKETFERMHRCEWNSPVSLSDSFILEKINADFAAWQTFNEPYDLIYFDAFAPEKQPAMWTQPIFDKLFGMTRNKGVFVTYCAKGVVRRMLQSSGFTVERIPGPPGKREMLRARK